MLNKGLTKLAIPFLLLLPYILLALPGVPKAQSRPIIMAALWIGCSAGTCWWGLDPRNEMLGPRASLLDSKYDAVRPRVVFVIRAFWVALGVSLFIYMGMPFALVSMRLAKGEKPTEVVGTVLQNSTPGFGAWFLLQKVKLSTNNQEYELYYSLVSLRYDERYELVTLPSSNLILDFRKLN